MKKPARFQSICRILNRNQVILDLDELMVYERDASHFRGKPQAVVFPQSTEDILQLIRWASGHGIPLVARGAGTGLSGGAVAEKGGIIVHFSRMNRILEFDIQGRSAVVEPGVVNQTIGELARTDGLFYPPDPSSGRVATLGGNVAENAGGPHCFKYGVTMNYITGLEVALADGRLVRVGGHALDYPEYDLSSLITGSEGTLGMITKIFLRLIHLPPSVKTLTAVFDSVEQAGVSVSAVIAAGLIPATMEMMDQKVIRVVEDYVHAGLPVEAGAMLIVDLDGYPDSLDPQIEEVAGIILQTGGRNLRIAQDSAERDRIWYARKSAAGAFARLGMAYFTLDGTVPRSLLAKALEASNAIADHYKLLVVYVFHAGDGNLHPHIFFDPKNASQVNHAQAAVDEITQGVVSLGGSITGEHGVGIEKRHFLASMYSPEEIGILLDIKHAFDPYHLFNPGKIFPTIDIASPRPGQELEIPGEIFVPTTVEEAGRLLAAHSQKQQNVQITGARSSTHIAGRQDAKLLCTEGLNAIHTFAPDDLYIRAGAGARLADLQVFLKEKGKQLALAAPWKEATIGGLVAANVNAPWRMRYGALRDQVLAMTVVLGDGRTIRAGRPVVKNVAGYDLPKGMVGSYGTLGLITDLTLKLIPLPRALQTVLVPVQNLEDGLHWARQVLPLAFVASAVVLYNDIRLPGAPLSPYGLAYTAEGNFEDVHAELDMVKDMLRACCAPEPRVTTGLTGTDLWSALLGKTRPGLVKVRVGVPPKSLAGYVQAQAQILKRKPFVLDVPSGIAWATACLDSAAEARTWIENLRRPALELGGYAVVLAAPPDWQQKIDLWGYRPEALHVMKEIKKRWDPAGILSPGFFVVP